MTFQHVTSKFGLCALLHRFEKMSCTFRGKHNTLETSIAILLGRRTLWQVLRRILFFANCNVRAASSANCPASIGNREWCRSVVCGISFCVAGAIFGTLYALHYTHYTLHMIGGQKLLTTRNRHRKSGWSRIKLRRFVLPCYVQE